MIVTTVAVLLVLAAGYLIGSQHERDRCRNRRHTTQAAPPAPATPEPLITDREWERFVVAIYELADRDNGQT